MEEKFLDLCSKGKLNELKEMYQKYNININAEDNIAFKFSCHYGHINIAQWLYSLGGVDIHAANDYVFRFSCINNHINIAQWLYSLGKFDIHAGDDYAFRFSCSFGNINIIRWLLLIDKFNNIVVDKYLPKELHEYAFDQGYLPINNMKVTYTQYKRKIEEQIKEKNGNGNISIFEIDSLVNIIITYI